MAFSLVFLGAGCAKESDYAQEAAGFRKQAERYRDVYIADSVAAQDRGEPSLLFDGTKYLGVRVWQNPCDLQAWQELVSEYQPDVIIETGTAQGGLALLFASTLDRVHPTGRVHAIEFDPKVDENLIEARKISVFDEYVTVHKGDSADPKWREELKPLTDGKRVIVTLDSDHSSVHVAKELALYADLVPPGGYLVVQDTVLDVREDYLDRFARWHVKDSPGGPGLAVDEFLKTDLGKKFRVAEEWEKYGLTFYPGGWLRREK